MPIPVTCRCGQSFAAGDHLAGRTVQCPKCKSPLTIPAPQAASTPAAGPAPQAPGGPGTIFEDAKMRTFAAGKPHCPSCTAELPPNAVLCVKCGYHLQLGRRIGPQGAGLAGDSHGSPAEALLARAARTLEEDKAEERKKMKEGMPWWAVGGIFALALTFLIGMLLLPGHEAFLYGGVVIFLIGFFVQLYHNIRILIIAFAESIVQGMLCLFVPCYMLIYIFMHWDECGAHFLWAFLMGIVINVGVGMIIAAPYMKPNPNQNVFLPLPERAVVRVVTELDSCWPRPTLKCQPA